MRVQVPLSAPINYSIGISSDKPSSIASSINGVSKIISVFSFFRRYASRRERMSHRPTIMYVNLPRKLEGPRAPNIEFDDPPPNADPKSEPFPC